MQHHVFLSYSDADQPAAERICRSLRAQGITVWEGDTGEAGILSPQDLYEQAILESGCVVVILSPDARQSRWVREHSTFAHKNRLPLLPLLVAGNKGDGTPPTLNDLQWIDATQNHEAAMGELVAAVYGRLNIGGGFSRMLAFWNPLDQATLLRWLFFAPGRYLAYRAFAGEKAARLTGSWLVSLLTWLPLLLATVGVAVRLSDAQTGFLFGGVLLVCWLLDSLAGALNDDSAGVMFGVGAFFLCLMLAFALAGGSSPLFNLLSGTALIVAGVIAAGVAHVVAGEVARFVALGAAIGTTVGVAMAQANIVVGGVILGVAFGVGILVSYTLAMWVVRQMQAVVQRREPSTASRAILAAWGLAYVTLVVVYFFLSL